MSAGPSPAADAWSLSGRTLPVAADAVCGAARDERRGVRLAVIATVAAMAGSAGGPA
jgi:hypothetical protein